MAGFKEDLAPNLTAKGYMPLDTILAGTENRMLSAEEGRNRIKLWQTTIDTTQYATILSDLEDFVKELRRRNIQVVFINTPALPVVTTLCDARIVQKNRAAIDDLCKRYNCKYFDYFTDPRFGPGDFSDVDHFNITGARHFSRVIDEEVLAHYITK